MRAVTSGVVFFCAVFVFAVAANPKACKKEEGFKCEENFSCCTLSSEMDPHEGVCERICLGPLLVNAPLPFDHTTQGPDATSAPVESGNPTEQPEATTAPEEPEEPEETETPTDFQDNEDRYYSDDLGEKLEQTPQSADMQELFNKQKELLASTSADAAHKIMEALVEGNKCQLVQRLLATVSVCPFIEPAPEGNKEAWQTQGIDLIKRMDAWYGKCRSQRTASAAGEADSQGEQDNVKEFDDFVFKGFHQQLSSALTSKPLVEEHLAFISVKLSLLQQFIVETRTKTQGHPVYGDIIMQNKLTKVGFVNATNHAKQDLASMKRVPSAALALMNYVHKNIDPNMFGYTETYKLVLASIEDKCPWQRAQLFREELAWEALATMSTPAFEQAAIESCKAKGTGKNAAKDREAACEDFTSLVETTLGSQTRAAVAMYADKVVPVLRVMAEGKKPGPMAKAKYAFITTMQKVVELHVSFMIASMGHAETIAAAVPKSEETLANQVLLGLIHDGLGAKRTVNDLDTHMLGNDVEHAAALLVGKVLAEDVGMTPAEKAEVQKEVKRIFSTAKQGAAKDRAAILNAQAQRLAAPDVTPAGLNGRVSEAEQRLQRSWNKLVAQFPKAVFVLSIFRRAYLFIYFWEQATNLRELLHFLEHVWDTVTVVAKSIKESRVYQDRVAPSIESLVESGSTKLAEATKAVRTGAVVAREASEDLLRYPMHQLQDHHLKLKLEQVQHAVDDIEKVKADRAATEKAMKDIRREKSGIANERARFKKLDTDVAKQKLADLALKETALDQQYAELDKKKTALKEGFQNAKAKLGVRLAEADKSAELAMKYVSDETAALTKRKELAASDDGKKLIQDRIDDLEKRRKALAETFTENKRVQKHYGKATKAAKAKAGAELAKHNGLMTLVKRASVNRFNLATRNALKVKAVDFGKMATRLGTSLARTGAKTAGKVLALICKVFSSTKLMFTVGFLGFVADMIDAYTVFKAGHTGAAIVKGAAAVAVLAATILLGPLGALAATVAGAIISFAADYYVKVEERRIRGEFAKAIGFEPGLRKASARKVVEAATCDAIRSDRVVPLQSLLFALLEGKYDPYNNRGRRGSGQLTPVKTPEPRGIQHEKSEDALMKLFTCLSQDKDGCDKAKQLVEHQSGDIEGQDITSYITGSGDDQNITVSLSKCGIDPGTEKTFHGDFYAAEFLKHRGCDAYVNDEAMHEKILKGLLDGWAGDRDERAVLDFFTCLKDKGKCNRVMELVGSYGFSWILWKMDGREDTQMRNLLSACGFPTTTDDDWARKEIGRYNSTQLAKLPVLVIRRLLKNLLNGWTGGADQTAMVALMKAVKNHAPGAKMMEILSDKETSYHKLSYGPVKPYLIRPTAQCYTHDQRDVALVGNGGGCARTTWLSCSQDNECESKSCSGRCVCGTSYTNECKCIRYVNFKNDVCDFNGALVELSADTSPAEELSGDKPAFMAHVF